MRPPSLRDVQRGFWASLHAGDPDPALAAVIPPTPSLEPARRIAIYMDMYVWRLVGVLHEDYPKVHEALGDDFDGLVRRYLARHPSEHPSVRWVGRHLPAFLDADRVANDRPWVADLARLERARVDAFDAPDAVPLRAADLAVVEPQAWADLRFAPAPAVEIVRSRWPVHEIWEHPAAEAPAPRDTVLRVWRQDFAVFHTAIDAVEQAAFAAFASGRPFSEICEAVAGHVAGEEAPAEAGALLARWIDDGLVASRIA